MQDYSADTVFATPFPDTVMRCARVVISAEDVGLRRIVT
jgi:hypothetical protein